MKILIMTVCCVCVWNHFIELFKCVGRANYYYAFQSIDGRDLYIMCK